MADMISYAQVHRAIGEIEKSRSLERAVILCASRVELQMALLKLSGGTPMPREPRPASHYGFGKTDVWRLYWKQCQHPHPAIQKWRCYYYADPQYRKCHKWPIIASGESEAAEVEARMWMKERGIVDEMAAYISLLRGNWVRFGCDKADPGKRFDFYR